MVSPNLKRLLKFQGFLTLLVLFFALSTNDVKSEETTINISSTRGSFYGGVYSVTSPDAAVFELFHMSDKPTLSGEISIYRSGKNDLLEYLKRDSKNNQVGSVDESDMDKLSEVGVTIGYGYSNKSEVQLPIPGDGVFLVVVEAGSAKQKFFLIKSSIGAVIENKEKSLLLWAQDVKTKNTLSSGSVEFYDLNRGTKKLFSGNLSAGFVEGPLVESMDIAVLESQDQLALVPINLTSLNTDYRYSRFAPSKEISVAYLFTDRPIYKPGDTVLFKGLVRRELDANYSIPSGSVVVELFEQYTSQETLQTKTFVISEDGSFDGEFKLPSDFKPGDYDLSVKTSEPLPTYVYGGYASFQVENYRKPEYTLNVAMPQVVVVSGDKAKFKVSGAYFNGNPLSGARVSYDIKFSDMWESNVDPKQNPIDSDFKYGYYWGYDYYKGSVKLDEKGEAEVEIPTKLRDIIVVRDYVKLGNNKILTISTTFRDATQNQVEDSKNILVLAGEYSIYKKDRKFAINVGETYDVPFFLSANTKGAKLSGVSLQLKISGKYWVKNKDPKSKYATYIEQAISVNDIFGTTDKNGEFVPSFKPEKAGFYTIKVLGQDSRDNPISKEFTLWVRNEKYIEDSYGSYEGIKVTTDKEEYFPGDKATITISSPVQNGDALFTIERSWVRKYQVVRVRDGFANLTFDIAESDIPNIHVRASTFDNDTFLNSYSTLNVSTAPKKIVTSVKFDKQRYAPGDEITVTVNTVDHLGKPLSTEVALWAIDKALLELASDKRGNVIDAFWWSRWNSTSLANSLDGIFSYWPGGGGGGGGGGMATRSVFKDTSFWFPKIKTDSNGTATIKTKLPDNATTWVVSAVGSTLDTKVGEISTDLLVTKDFLVRPVLPNVARVGDQLKVSAYVHNYTDKSESFDVLVKGTNLPETTKKLSVPANSSKRVYSDWTASDLLKADFTMTASSKLGGDSVASSLKILPRGFYDKKVQIASDSTGFDLSIGKNSNKKLSTSELYVSSSLTENLFSSVDYLIGYSYGCVEQSSSILVATLAVKKHPEMFSKYLSGRKNLDLSITEYLKKVEKSQTGYGGWPWLEGGPINPFVTVHAVESLVEARNLGYKIEPSTFENAKYYSENQIDQVTEPTTPILKNYLLVLLGSNKATQIRTAQYALTPDYLAYAVMANYKLGVKDPSKNGLNELIALAQPMGDALYWEAGDPKNFGSVDASTALAIRAILMADGDINVAKKAVRYLSVNRKHDYWTNTFATAQVTKAFVEFAAISKESNPNFTYTVTLDGAQVYKEKVGPNPPAAKIPIPLDNVTDKSKLEVKKEGEGQIYLTLVTKEFKESLDGAFESTDIEIKREYLDENRNLYKVFGVGDEVTIRLTVTNRAGLGDYAVLEDTLPSGLVPVNENLESEIPIVSQGMSQRKVYKEDGVLIYTYSLPVGVSSYEYKARVVSEGKFYTPPANVALMYLPEVFAQSDSLVLEVASKKSVEWDLAEQARIFVKKVLFNKVTGAVLIALGVAFLGFVVIKKRFGKKFKKAQTEAKNDLNNNENEPQNKSTGVGQNP